MANAIDYSTLPVGTKIHGHEVGLCPKCGRNGLVSRTNGATNYLHALRAFAELLGGDPPDDVRTYFDEEGCDVEARESTINL
jgi:hypothetical protein